MILASKDEHSQTECCSEYLLFISVSKMSSGYMYISIQTAVRISVQQLDSPQIPRILRATTQQTPNSSYSLPPYNNSFLVHMRAAYI